MWRAVLWRKAPRPIIDIVKDKTADIGLREKSRMAIITERVAQISGLLVSGEKIEEGNTKFAKLFAMGNNKDGGPTELQSAVDRLFTAASRGNIKECNSVLFGKSFVGRQERLAVRKLVNVHVFLPKGLEWTSHGAKKTFRFWTDGEKAAYLGQTMRVARVLESLSPHVSLGFGAALGYLRNKDLISHDDDTDLVIAFPKSEVPKLSIGRQIVFDALSAAGFRCSGDYLSHWNVFFEDGEHCDVFVGLIEGSNVSFYPSRRDVLAVSDVFPARVVDFFGVPCAFPADIETYVEKTYGRNWREPIPFWNHPANKGEYHDIA